MNFNPGGKRGGKAEKARNTKYTLKRLWDYLYYYKWLLITALCLTVITNVLALVGPMLSGYAIDAITLEGEVEFGKVYFYEKLSEDCIKDKIERLEEMILETEDRELQESYYDEIEELIKLLN